MISYDKSQIKEQLKLEDYFELLEEFGGHPEYTSFGIISDTICHNEPEEGSRKLYFYENSQLFHCFTGCENPNFDILELVIKVYEIQYHKILDLNESVRWVAQRFGIQGAYLNNDFTIGLDDWTILKNYDRIQEINIHTNRMVLKEYDSFILSKFNYNLEIVPWIKDNISKQAIDKAKIGIYPGGAQITIPHYDIDGRFIGLRGRSLVAEEAELYGKYRPISVNGVMYSHPLGMNLYGLNWAKSVIGAFRKAIIVESEKAVLQASSFFFPLEAPVVATCGSSLSAHQFQLLMDCGADEIIIAFDKDFEALGDKVFEKQVKNLTNIHNRYSPYTQISFMFDRNNNILPLKASPTELGKEVFFNMFNNRFSL